MSGVIVRPQRIAEYLTAATPQRMKHCRFFFRLLPVTTDLKPLAISQLEACHIPGIGGGMFTEPPLGTMINITAGGTTPHGKY